MKRLKKFFRSLYAPCSKFIHERWAVIFPRCYAGYVFKKNYHRNLNLKDPQDYNEKIQWLKVYSDTSLWTTLADKYKVREYVTQCGLGENLPELYGVWKRAEDIDFSKLPDRFVLKTNHGYHRLIIVKDKNKLDVKDTVRCMNKWVRERYGLLSFEPHYWNIERRIIAEELLEDEYNSSLSKSLIDYKFHCIHGEPVIIEALYDRKIMMVGGDVRSEGQKVKSSAFDLSWNPRPELWAIQYDNLSEEPLPKPGQLEEMIRICRILAKPFPLVRVDLYEVNNKVFFGEMTFTPGGGKDIFTPEYFLELGKSLDLSAVKLRPKRLLVR